MLVKGAPGGNYTRGSQVSLFGTYWCYLRKKMCFKSDWKQPKPVKLHWNGATFFTNLNIGIEGSWVRVPTREVFLFHNVSIVSKTIVHSRNRCCCPRTVGISYVNFYKQYMYTLLSCATLAWILAKPSNNKMFDWIWACIKLRCPEHNIKSITAYVCRSAGSLMASPSQNGMQPIIFSNSIDCVSLN